MRKLSEFYFKLFGALPEDKEEILNFFIIYFLGLNDPEDEFFSQ